VRVKILTEVLRSADGYKRVAQQSTMPSTPARVSSILGGHPKQYTADIHWHAKKGRPTLTALLQNASRGTSSRRIGFVSSVDEHVVTCSPILHYNSFMRTKVRSRS